MRRHLANQLVIAIGVVIIVVSAIFALMQGN
jgi:hypothetical protein